MDEHKATILTAHNAVRKVRGSISLDFSTSKDPGLSLKSMAGFEYIEPYYLNRVHCIPPESITKQIFPEIESALASITSRDTTRCKRLRRIDDERRRKKRARHSRGSGLSIQVQNTGRSEVDQDECISTALNCETAMGNVDAADSDTEIPREYSIEDTSVWDEFLEKLESLGIEKRPPKSIMDPEPNPDAIKFLKAMKWLRIVIVQDVAVMLNSGLYNDCSLFKHEIFQTPEFLEYRVKMREHLKRSGPSSTTSNNATDIALADMTRRMDSHYKKAEEKSKQMEATLMVFQEKLQSLTEQMDQRRAKVIERVTERVEENTKAFAEQVVNFTMEMMKQFQTQSQVHLVQRNQGSSTLSGVGFSLPTEHANAQCSSLPPNFDPYTYDFPQMTSVQELWNVWFVGTSELPSIDAIEKHEMKNNQRSAIAWRTSDRNDGSSSVSSRRRVYDRYKNIIQHLVAARSKMSLETAIKMADKDILKRKGSRKPIALTTYGDRIRGYVLTHNKEDNRFFDLFCNPELPALPVHKTATAPAPAPAQETDCSSSQASSAQALQVGSPAPALAHPGSTAAKTPSLDVCQQSSQHPRREDMLQKKLIRLMKVYLQQNTTRSKKILHKQITDLLKELNGFN